MWKTVSLTLFYLAHQILPNFDSFCSFCPSEHQRMCFRLQDWVESAPCTIS